MSDGAKPLTVAPQSIVKPRNGEPTFSYRSRSARMRGCDAYWSACTSSARVTPCSSAIGASASIESGSIEICTRAIGKPSFAAALICSVM